MVAELSILSRVVDFLSRFPSPAEVLSIKATSEEEDRIDYLIERKNSGGISELETDELKESLIAQHLMVIAKANALGVIKRLQS